MACLHLLILKLSVLFLIAELILIDSSFVDNPLIITWNQYYIRQCCSLSSCSMCDTSTTKTYTTCSNGLQYLIMNQNNYKLIGYYSNRCSRFQIIFDISYKYPDQNTKFSVKFQTSDQTQTCYSKVYTSTSTYQQSNQLCFTEQSYYNYDIYTVVSNSLNNGQSTYQYAIFELGASSQTQVLLRNILMYAEICHPACKSCNGPNFNQCLSCYEGSVQSGLCQCNGQYFIQPITGCIVECSRDYYIGNSDKICIYDKRIKSKFQYFSTTITLISPFMLIPNIYNQENIQQIITINSINLIGKFKFNQGMYYQMPNINALQFLRIRITFCFFNLQIGSKINIYLDYQLYCQIEAISSSIFQANDCTTIFQNSIDCNKMRIEKVVQVATTSPLLTLQGQLQLDTESWGFNNVTIDVGLCQENCKLCSNFYKCQKCENGYLLYQNRCVVNCPIHSSECVDYEDIIPYSKYLAKGFYDMNMTIDQINTFYDTVTNPTTNFLTGQKFSFFRQKFVLGGLMVWNDAIYSKTWQILKPHYAISIRFNLTYGDEFSGNFYYKIDNQQSDAFVKPLTGGQNFIGREKEERTSHFYIYKDPHKSSQLSFEVQCTGGIGDIRQEFCAISEYFIIVHYCPPFCSNCESDKICNTWESGYSSSQCDANKYISFNSISQTYSCNSCTQIGCVTCNSLEECTQCDLVKNFQLSNGVCTCHPFYYLSGNQCLRCNQYCGNCNGSNNNCISCITEHFRYLSKNNCICQIGYYDDGINFICLPICGDLLIVEGEDCDDGNFNPFDGCHNCKYQCEETCLICIEGQCLMCIDGYDIVQNKCVLVCGDNLILYPEQCEDDNLIPYDGCFNCQFSCSQHCIDCQNGKCIQCDNQNGWYLFDDNTCQTICGDGIKVLYNEQCDDGNDNPFDYCDNCIFSDIAKKNNCEIFIQNRCMRCENGYQLEKRTNNCIKKCKENEIVIIKEICGDNNNMKYDGCYKCELSCQESCTNCKSQGCLECNVKGWKHNISKMKCETICGDGITILEYEECDDQINKNCQNCKFKCQESCDICLKGDCLKCKKGWYLNNYNQICYPQIGDLLVVGYEQCDDMNGIMNDGCYESQYQCQIVCISCYFGLCKKCQDGYIIINNKCIEISGDGIIVGQEECEDQNLIGLDGCFQQKYDCPLYCKICVKGQCLVCNQELGYQQFDIYKNICVSICGDNIKQIDEDCDDGNNIQFDGCFNCQFECDLYCIDCIQGICQQCMDGYYLNRKHNNCESICGDGIVVGNEQCDDGNKIIDDGCSDCKFQCHKYCIACVHGICVECRGIGWEINQINGQCQPLCGDGYIIDYEQCDDGNDIREDGCFECYFECQKECAKCIEGECMECGILGWDLEQGRCIPHCGDKLVVGDEECDDGNLIAFDGCYYCKYHCQDQCTDCKKGICYECKIEGWNILNHICYPVCGDGYVVQGYEQCDDGNQLQYDGCYLCAYQCEFKCTNCQMGICYECNQFGWIIDNYNKCIPICGDGIIIGNEQCDDMNNEYNDGCFQCQNVCDQYCTNCFNGICYSCQPGRFVYANVCVSFCGDGYYVPQNENCDDGNDLNNDGCNQNCQIEENFNCINTIGASSKCFYSKKPNIQINILTTNLQDYQEVEITFDQKVKYSNLIKGDILNNISTNLTSLLNNEFNIIKSISQQPFDQNEGEIKINLKIYIYVPIIDPQLNIIFIDDPIISTFNQSLKQNSVQIQLLTPLVLTENQKYIVFKTNQFNEIVIYSLVGLSTLCLATSSQDIFWNLLDMLQFLSYINYINVQFPSNLNIYFDVFKLVSIQPLLKLGGFDTIYDLYDNQTKNLIQVQHQFKNTATNPLFLFNIFSFILFSILGYLGYQVANLLKILIHNYGASIASHVNLYIGNKMRSFQHFLQKKVSKFYYNGLLRIYMSNYYDCCFAAAIQLAYFSSNTYFITINSYFSLITYFLCFCTPIYFIQLNHNFQKKATFKNINQFEILFEGIKQNQTYWSRQYNSILLFKKYLFISIIVFLQKEGQLQIILIAINQTLFSCYLIAVKPLSNKFENYKCQITESVQIFNVLTFLAYSNSIELGLSQQGCINLGWVNIFFSSFILAINLYFDLMQQLKMLILNCKSKFISVQENKQNLQIGI